MRLITVATAFSAIAFAAESEAVQDWAVAEPAEAMYRPPSPEEQLSNLLRQMAEVEAAFAHHPEPFLERQKEDIMRSIGQVKLELKDAIADGKWRLENWWNEFATDPKEGWKCAAVWDNEHPGDFGYMISIEYTDKDKEGCCLWVDQDYNTDWSEYDAFYANRVLAGNLQEFPKMPQLMNLERKMAIANLSQSTVKKSTLLQSNDCADNEGEALDSTWDGCAGYWNWQSLCGAFDDDDFTASDMCCACGGGQCVDNEGDALDSTWDGCAGYWGWPSLCGAFDDDDFTASEMCCACKQDPALNLMQTPAEKNVVFLQESNAKKMAAQNLAQKPVAMNLQNDECIDIEGDALDSTWDGCAGYWNWQSLCGAFDDDDFTASDLCCACGGGGQEVCEDSEGDALDSTWDGCAGYWNWPSLCGAFDDDDFTASEMCCACQQESAYNLAQTPAVKHLTFLQEANSKKMAAQNLAQKPVAMNLQSDTCADNEGDALDSTWDGCAGYWNWQSLCGAFDDDDFTASDMCCACGGGQCVDSEGDALDSTWDGCAGYWNWPSLCGAFDDDDFTASEMCCACKQDPALNLADKKMTEEEVMQAFGEGMGEIFDVHGDDGIPIEEELEALDKYSHLPWDDIDKLVEDLNNIGTNPGFYLNMTTEMLNQQLDEIENNVNRSIGDFNENILRMIRESNEEYGMNLHTKEYAAVEEVLRSHGLGSENLQYYPDEPLGVPEWNITLDKDVAEAGAEEILNDYEEWTAVSDHITHDWMTDRKLIDDYYWRYEMEPHLQKGAKLDEKTLRSIVTYIADSTTIRGRPLRQVQPGIEEWMIDNYDPEGPSIYEKFGFMNLQEYGYDYETGTWGYNYGNEQKYDDYSYDKYDDNSYYYDDSYKYDDNTSWDEELIDGVEDVADEVGDAVEDLLRSPPSTYSFDFDTDMINAWLDKEGRNYETISRMYTQEYEDLQRAVEDLLREHEENIRTIDNHLEEQIESTSHDIEEWLEDSLSIEPLNLSAKVQGESKDASTGDIMMYAACAIATMCLVFMNFRHIGKREDAIPQVDVFERLI